MGDLARGASTIDPFPALRRMITQRKMRHQWIGNARRVALAWGLPGFETNCTFRCQAFAASTVPTTAGCGTARLWSLT
jgi:hypothetical protein